MISFVIGIANLYIGYLLRDSTRFGKLIQAANFIMAGANLTAAIQLS